MHKDKQVEALKRDIKKAYTIYREKLDELFLIDEIAAEALLEILNRHDEY